MGETTAADDTRGLWSHGDFRNLWAGQTVSQFAAQISQLTLPLIAVIALAAPAGKVGLLRAVEQLPYLLFALFIGALVDRWRRRNVMISANFARAAALGTIPVAYALSLLGMPFLYVIGFSIGTFTVFFDVAYQAYLPGLVDRDQLARANSMLEGSKSAAQIGGPALGGSLVTLLTAPVAIVSSALLFLYSAVSIWRIRTPETRVRSTGSGVGVLRQIVEGIVLVARSPILRTVAITAGVFNFSFSAFMTLYLLFLPRELHLSGAEIGVALAAFGPGFLAGALFAATLPRRFGYGPVLVLSAAVSDGVMLIVAAVHGSGVPTVAALMAINVCYATVAQTFNVALMAVRQAFTSDEIQGRVVATIRFIGMGLAPIGAALGGLVAEGLGLRTSLLLAAIGMCLAPVVLVFSPMARLGRDLPAPDEPIADHTVAAVSHSDDNKGDATR